jgi:ankyrin repeat protein
MQLNQFEIRILKACFENNVDTVKELLPLVDSVNFENEHSNYPLKIAVLNNCYDMVKLLIDNCAIVNWIDNDGENILSSIPSVEILTILIQNGLDIHHKENELESPLDYICYYGSLDVAAKLIELGVKYEHLDLSQMKTDNREDAQKFKKTFDIVSEKNRLNQSFTKNSDSHIIHKIKL